MKQPFSLFRNIKRARVMAELSQRELATKLDLSDKTVSAYETGRAIPPTPTLARISEITGVSISDLLEIKETNHAENRISRKLNELSQRISEMEKLLAKNRK